MDLERLQLVPTLAPKHVPHRSVPAAWLTALCVFSACVEESPLQDAGSGESDGGGVVIGGDAGEGPASVCEANPASHALFVFDSQGPVALIGAPGATEVTHVFSGTVMDQGRGFPKDSAPNGIPVPEQPEEFRFLRVADAGRSWTVALQDAQNGGFSVANGARVKLSLTFKGGGFSPEHKTLSIRVDEQLAFFYTLGGSVAELPIPDELEVVEGAATCTRHDQCGSWSRYALNVAATGVAAQSLRTGEQKRIGPFVVTNAGDEQQLPTPGIGCSDWFVSRAELIAFRDVPLGAPPSACPTTSTSTLPLVQIAFPADVKCRFSVAEAAAGISVPYSVVAVSDGYRVIPTPTATSRCMPSAVNGLHTFEELTGNQQSYAVRDLGLCPEPSEQPISLTGTYPHSFSWDGRNWSGPSDTSQPKGPAFPPGVYTLSISTKGRVVEGPSVSGQPSFEIKSTLQITLTP